MIWSFEIGVFLLFVVEIGCYRPVLKKTIIPPRGVSTFDHDDVKPDIRVFHGVRMFAHIEPHECGPPRVRVIKKKRNVGVGVNRDTIHIRYRVECISGRNRPSSRNCLNYSKPCICGSNSHASRRSAECLLNRKYEDV